MTLHTTEARNMSTVVLKNGFSFSYFHIKFFFTDFPPPIATAGSTPILPEKLSIFHTSCRWPMLPSKAVRQARVSGKPRRMAAYPSTTRALPPA